MKKVSHPFIVLGALLSMAPFSRAQTSKEELTYLDHVANIAPLVAVNQDAILGFEDDVTGDGTTELFFTKASLRDGKQGYIWSIYGKKPDGTIQLIGDETFSHLVFAPSTWSSDSRTRGFYSYFPSGGGRGSMVFFEVSNAGMVRRESREIEPTGADKDEFDRLFSKRLKGEVPQIELRQTLLTKPLDQTIIKGENSVLPPSSTGTNAKHISPDLEFLGSTPQKSNAVEPSLVPPRILWTIVAMGALGLLWLIKKRRQT